MGHGSFAWQVALICQTLLPNQFTILPCIKELKPGQESMYINIETAHVTSTFEIGACFYLLPQLKSSLKHLCKNYFNSLHA